MKKLSTLFKKDPNDLGRVINEVNPENQWVFDGEAIPTQKFDGTACMVKDDILYKRYDCKINTKTEEYKRPIPEGAIPCQEADAKSGHHPHWVKCDRSNPADKWHFQAFDKHSFDDGTYELCGKKVQGNPENIEGHELITHGGVQLDICEYDFETIKAYLSNPSNNIEGIVFHHVYSDKMCKIRKADFGVNRQK